MALATEGEVWLHGVGYRRRGMAAWRWLQKARYGCMALATEGEVWLHGVGYRRRGMAARGFGCSHVTRLWLPGTRLWLFTRNEALAARDEALAVHT